MDESGRILPYFHNFFGNWESWDNNPFRYCGEYFDDETGTLYLRARRYDASIGRFTQQDTHWNPGNSIYGDHPRKLNENSDPLGLNLYTIVPDTAAMLQSGNLYVYGMNNPVMFMDPMGEIGTPISWALAAIAGIIGGFLGNYLADQYGLNGWKRAALIAGVAVGGAAIGFIAGELLVGFVTTFLVSNPAIMMCLPTTLLSLFGLNGDNIAVLGRYAVGVGYINLAQKLGASFFQIATDVWNKMTPAQQWAANQKFLDDMIRVCSIMTIYTKCVKMS